MNAYSTELATSVQGEMATLVHGFGHPLGGRASGRREASAYPLIITSFSLVSA
jgi:hypothetical protein